MSKLKEEYNNIIRPFNENPDVLICDAYVSELEAEKAELISDFNTLYNGCQNLAIRQYCLAVLQKYEVLK